MKVMEIMRNDAFHENYESNGNNERPAKRNEHGEKTMKNDDEP